MLDRIKKRLEGEKVSDDTLKELISTVSDRLCIRLGENSLPDVFQSICVDAAIKLFRRTYFEGISSEGSGDMSTSFVDNILAEYEQEIEDWKEQKSNAGGSGRMVMFL